jgi:pimeloyl-ACP methyl ester carboxylesterase
MNESETRSVTVGNIDVAVEVQGCGAESVLFVHGLGSNRDCWYRANEFFDLERYRLILPDLPGFGDSARPSDFDYSMASLGDCLGRVVRELGVENPHIVAHSMGCAVALGMLETQAIRPASFAAAEGNLAAEDAFMSTRITRFSEPDFLRAYSMWLSVMEGFLGDQSNPQHERFIESLHSASPVAVYRAAGSCSERSCSGALSRQYAALGCPLAYVYGADTLKQRPIPEVAHLPHVQRFAIPDQGHFMMQAAEHFYSHLEAFISSSTNPGARSLGALHLGP